MNQSHKMNLRIITRLVVLELDRVGGPENARNSVEPIRYILNERGLLPGCHVGRKDMTPEEIVEWYAGQVVKTVDDGAWFVMNTIINMLDTYCPAVASEGTKP